jgi:hypothetical protein
VARLKEAARKAKQGQESSFDRVVARGRVWADRAHKFTTLSLIGFTGKYILSLYLSRKEKVSAASGMELRWWLLLCCVELNNC